MKLKKINEKLQDALIENGLTEANILQQETFSTIKSGADCIILSPEGSGKSTTIVLNVIQQLAGHTEESPRALIFVEDKDKVLEMVDAFCEIWKIYRILKFMVFMTKAIWIMIKIIFQQELMF